MSHYAWCHYAECHYAWCHYAEYRGANAQVVVVVVAVFVWTNIDFSSSKLIFKNFFVLKPSK